MELLEGETMAQRLASGALPLELVLRYAGQIADALEKAHRSGIVHRDLKPANVMLTKSGVKLLDFGLAKAWAPAAASVAATAPLVPPLTAHGAVAGTVQYMAPEQLAGHPADARSDIYALGAVIYEMAAGKRAFATTPQTIEPPTLDRIVRGCLATDPDERWQSAHDVRLQLAAAGERLDGVGPAAGRSRGRWIPWAIATAAVAVAFAAWFRPVRAPSISTSTVRLALPPPPPHGEFSETVESTTLSVSPDGSRIAFAGGNGVDPQRLWVRPLTEVAAYPLAGTDGATSVFWSPDGRSLGYSAGGKLRRIDIRGGAAPVSVCDIPDGFRSGTWGADGQILFTSIEGGAIWRVPAGGGAPVALITSDASRNVTRLNWPVFLPDGRRFCTSSVAPTAAAT